MGGPQKRFRFFNNLLLRNHMPLKLVLGQVTTFNKSSKYEKKKTNRLFKAKYLLFT